MKKLLLTIVALLLAMQFAQAQHKPKKKKKMPKQNVAKSFDFSRCLPNGITLETVVSTKNMGFDSVTMTQKVATIDVKQTLSKLGGKCVSGKLVDKSGKEIRFYNLQDCWGNPPADYLEILANQRRELEELRKTYSVIELTCNPSGGLIG